MSDENHFKTLDFDIRALAALLSGIDLSPPDMAKSFCIDWTPAFNAAALRDDNSLKDLRFLGGASPAFPTRKL